MTTLASGQPELLGAAQRRLATAVAASLALHTLAWQLLPPIHTQIAPLTHTLEVLLVAQTEVPPRAIEPARLSVVCA